MKKHHGLALFFLSMLHITQTHSSYMPDETTQKQKQKIQAKLAETRSTKNTIGWKIRSVQQKLRDATNDDDNKPTLEQGLLSLIKEHQWLTIRAAVLNKKLAELSTKID